MSQLHLLLAYGAAALAIAAVLVAVAAMAAGSPLRLLLDRAVLIAAAALLLAALSGLPLLVIEGAPADALHLLYGAVGPLVLLGGRYLGRSGSIRRRATLVAIAALALLGVIYRLFTTGSPAA